jgi:hypothetical protein
MRLGGCATTALAIAAVLTATATAADPPYTLTIKTPKGFRTTALNVGDNAAFVPLGRARVHSTGRLPYFMLMCPSGCSVRLSVTLLRPRTPVRAKGSVSIVHQLAPATLTPFVARFTPTQLRAIRGVRNATLRARVKVRDADGLHRGTIDLPIR